MKKLLLLAALAFSQLLAAQLTIDTLAFQNFEVTPAAPVWNFTGPVIYNSGFSGRNTCKQSGTLSNQKVIRY